MGPASRRASGRASTHPTSTPAATVFCRARAKHCGVAGMQACPGGGHPSTRGLKRSSGNRCCCSCCRDRSRCGSPPARSWRCCSRSRRAARARRYCPALTPAATLNTGNSAAKRNPPELLPAPRGEIVGCGHAERRCITGLQAARIDLTALVCPFPACPHLRVPAAPAARQQNRTRKITRKPQ